MKKEENSHLILCNYGNGITISSVQVHLDEKFNMKIHPLFTKNKENVWQIKLQQCSNLFNGSKFRLHNVELEESGKSVLPIVKMLIGITSYKDFIGTNCAPYANQLVCDGLKDFNNSQAYLADPIGVGGLLISSEDDVIFIRRSNKCAEMPLLIDRPGGHPEPDVVIENEQKMDTVEGCKITEEIFNSVLKEIRDEVNIPLKHLSTPILLGINYNPNSWRRPSLEFFLRCSLKTSEIQKLYQEQTQAESYESTDLIIMPLKTIIENDVKHIPLYPELTYPAKSALYFLKIYVKQNIEV